MKSNIIIKFILLFTIYIIINSCSIDDIKPTNEFNEKNVITTAAKARAFTAGLYERVRHSNQANPLLWSGLMGNLYSNYNFTGGDDFEVNKIKIVGNDSHLYYRDVYKIINQANWLIQLLEEKERKIADLSKEERMELIATGKFFRADGNFQLLRRFGVFYDITSSDGIILRTTPSKDIEKSPRSSVKEVYDLIIKDLEYATSSLKATEVAYKVSQVTAKALLSKVYLYIKEFEKAASLSLEVINSGYGLESNYQDVFAKGLSSQEILFAPYYSTDERIANHRYLYAVDISFDALNFFDAADGTPDNGDLGGASSGYDPRFGWAYAKDNTYRNYTGLAKYNPSRTGDSNTFYFYRLAEYYLVYAEAETRRNGGSLSNALEKLNLIRRRAWGDLTHDKTLSTPETLLEDIRIEKKLELFSETGESWFDLIRYAELGNLDISAIKSSITSKNQYILPFNEFLLRLNEKLTQNTGYEDPR